MRIVHRISIAATPEIQQELAALGVSAGAGLFTFEVEESDGRWPGIAAWATRRRAVDVPSTRFSRKEIADARWLELQPDWHHGYPQPEEGFGYLAATYEIRARCPKCGVGLEQQAPFRMRGEPQWGRNGLLQMNWVFDEFFATPEAWRRVFEPLGVRRGPVLDGSGGQLTTVVQLEVHEEVPIVEEGLASEVCHQCGRKRFSPVARGMFPALAAEPRAHLVKTSQYFGSGASAARRVLVSQTLARAIADYGLRGASLRPVAEAGQAPEAIQRSQAE